MKSRSAALVAALCFSLLILLLLISSANLFYYRCVPPRDFQRGDPLDVQVKKLSSLWEVIRGDHIQNSMNSMYTFNMMEEHPCKVLGRAERLGAEFANSFKEKIRDGHRVNLILDNLPVVERHSWDGTKSTTTYTQGFPVGFTATYAGSKEVKYFIYNHLSFRVMFHKHLANDSAQIVGFEVTPYSINHQYIYKDYKKLMIITCGEQTKYIIRSGSVGPQEVDAHKLIILTYDVTFVESDIKGESRWDHLTKNTLQSKTPMSIQLSKSVQAVVNVAWP
ncbi:hypothetical protein Vadar_002489 [Vaccinium darrowii]|uniref:Uncharacterized protein n=1 Tax=Vaccinium darrowii TaxID=229202 RepID=A0ACB7YSX1_9ERIC|nr:hypothetical protein Vadar_002489 [Vaccinium darrowii]